MEASKKTILTRKCRSIGQGLAMFFHLRDIYVLFVGRKWLRVKADNCVMTRCAQTMILLLFWSDLFSSIVCVDVSIFYEQSSLVV